MAENSKIIHDLGKPFEQITDRLCERYIGEMPDISISLLQEHLREFIVAESPSYISELKILLNYPNLSNVGRYTALFGHRRIYVKPIFKEGSFSLSPITLSLLLSLMDFKEEFYYMRRHGYNLENFVNPDIRGFYEENIGALSVAPDTVIRETLDTYATLFCGFTDCIDDTELRWEVLWRLLSERSNTPPFNKFDSYASSLAFTANGLWGETLGYCLFENAVNPTAAQGDLINPDIYNLLIEYRKNNMGRFHGGCPVSKVHESPTGYSAITLLGQVILQRAETYYSFMEENNISAPEFR